MAPLGRGTESLSHIMAQDLAGCGVIVNMLLPGGMTETGMLPGKFRVQMGTQLLRPEVMVEPALFLCSDESKSVHDERIVPKDFSSG